MRAILTYHSIDRLGSIISVTPEAFRSHVEWLAASHVRTVPLAELLQLSDDVDAVAVTFDDALVSIATNAAPILADLGVPATVFVVTQCVGGDNRWGRGSDAGIPVQAVLGWDELAKLRARGFMIGAHTRRHRQLPRCSDAELVDELGGSADDIMRALGERPTSFAYPYGSIDDRVTHAARAHFAIACTTEHRLVTAATNPARVPRLDAWYFADAGRLRSFGSTAFRRWVALRHGLRRIRGAFR